MGLEKGKGGEVGSRKLGKEEWMGMGVFEIIKE